MQQPQTVSVINPLQKLKAKVLRALRQRTHALEEVAVALKSDAEAASLRLSWHGDDSNLTDIDPMRLVQDAAGAQALREVLGMISEIERD